MLQSLTCKVFTATDLLFVHNFSSVRSTLWRTRSTMTTIAIHFTFLFYVHALWEIIAITHCKSRIAACNMHHLVAGINFLVYYAGSA